MSRVEGNIFFSKNFFFGKGNNRCNQCPVVTALRNKFLSSYTWPTAWKEADINPLPKVDTPVQYSDFRGINMTPVIGSCFERTVYHHYSKKVFEGNLTVIQYAYREGCSCKETLIQIQYNYLNALDDKDCNYVRLFAMDFSKAFDNVKHSLVSEKPKALHLNPNVVNWYLSFLMDRKQRLIFKGVTYKWH